MWLALYIFIALIIIIAIYAASNIKIYNPISINFNQNPLMKLDNYSDVSGIIDGKFPVDINLQNKFINQDNEINTTAFYQNNPYGDYKVTITYKDNEYYINQYLNGTLNGIFSFKLNGTNIDGDFFCKTNSKNYKFKASLVNYDSGKLMLMNNINENQDLYKNFLDYPFYKIHHSVGTGINSSNNSYGTLEYNAYTGQIIEFPKKNDGKVYKIVPEKSNTNYGIDLNKYYKDTLLGTYNLIYSKGIWYGAYYSSNGKSVSYASLNGYY